MDPTFITTAEWAQTGQILRFFFAEVLFIICFAGNMLLALAFLPSLVTTGHLPRAILGVRPMLLVIAFSSLAMVVYFFFRMIQLHDVFGVLYPGRWLF